MTAFLEMLDLDLSDKRVLIREDFNVPLKDGQIESDARIRAGLATLRYAVDRGAKVMVVSHLGRPTPGEFDAAFSLAPVAERLQELLGLPVSLERNWRDGVHAEKNKVVLLENIRFELGEKADDDQLAKDLAALCDIFVMDAFGTAHRAQASTHGVAKYAKQACAGPLLTREIQKLSKILKDPAKPMIAIVGGSKLSTKLSVLESLLDIVDVLITGGGIANTLLAAQGSPVGRSLVEYDAIEAARRLLSRAAEKNTEVPLPVDVVVAKEMTETALAVTKDIRDVEDDEMILDIGPRTAELYFADILEAQTIVWNGPLGVFEFESFAAGTKRVAEAVAESFAFSIVGGGDTLSALDHFGLSSRVSYISTGGGAFLKFLEGAELPAIEILKARAASA